MSEHSTVMVTAGASGIGRAISELFLASEYSVHVCDIEQSALDDFLGSNPQATGTCGDVASAADVDRVFADLIGHYDDLDVLVNNAGIAGPTAQVEDIDPDEWTRTVAVIGPE